MAAILSREYELMTKYSIFTLNKPVGHLQSYYPHHQVTATYMYLRIGYS